MPRPLKLTPERTESVCRYILAGNTDRVSAVLSGIHYATFQAWMSRGAKGEKPYNTFFEAVEKAKAEIEERMVSRAFNPTDPEPESALTWLRTRRQADWTQHAKIDATVETVTRVVFRLPEVGEGDDQDD